MKTITLTASMRSNLSSLKQLSKQMGRTQKNLSTGKKVNSAIDNASSYYQSRSLNNRAADLDSLLDLMGQGIQTIQSASQGIEAGLKTIEQMKSVAESAIETEFEPSYFAVSKKYDGRVGTQAIIDELQNKGMAAVACNKFYAPGVSVDDENFGQGEWYLGSSGEWIDVYNNKTDITRALNDLYNVSHSLATTLGNNTYWSSSESSDTQALGVSMSNGAASDTTKTMMLRVRAFAVLENKFEANETKPIVGNIMYSDLSYGSSRDYDSSKSVVGVVTWVSEDGGSVRIMNLRDFKFSAYNQVNNFDPTDPYDGGSTNFTSWAHSDVRNENVEGIDDIVASEAASVYASTDHGTWVIDSDMQKAREQFNAIYSAYDEMIKDASYRGVNLLQGDNLDIMFNESRTHSYTVQGHKADASSLGIGISRWNNMSDIENSLEQLLNAKESLRNISQELGNSYSIIETRQSFTDVMISVLETGADDLVLADMNEESACYLALQTRQQLAVNALSLASQSNNSVLKLF